MANYLKDEKSPYLLQHAHDPVDWYPYGEKALERARKEDRPLFLSIGYSTCHWCHVMARESFADEEVAALLRRHFIAVKVDREERPDVDAVYMAACQAMTGSGGWPLTILATPEGKPFFAATYLPKNGRAGMMGLVSLLRRAADLWETDRAALVRSGEEIADLLRRQAEDAPAPGAPDRRIPEKAVRWFSRQFDGKWGGFGPAPKFPSPHNLIFLLRYSVLENDPHARGMADRTLEGMCRGGIYDHLGGGFCRYSTDERWLVPHFEKMLYDNALMVIALLEAHRISGRPLFRRTAEATLRYMEQTLSLPEGGFACGQDADSDGVEGKYYLFTPEEIRQVLGASAGERFCRRFGVTEKGHLHGGSVLSLLASEDFEQNDPETRETCARLLAARSRRPALHLDDKVLTSWNALAIIAFARAARVLDEPAYLKRAEEAWQMIVSRLTTPEGRLFLRWRDGEAAHAGQLDDYAFCILALIELYAAAFRPEYLTQATALAEWMCDLFPDEDRGGFFLTARNGERLIHRPKEVYDGAIPSGNSAAALALGRLARLTGEPRWAQEGERQLAFVSAAARRFPAGHSLSLLAITEALWPTAELICVTAQPHLPEGLRPFAGQRLFPNLSVLLKTPDHAALLSEAAPFTADYPIPPSDDRYYLCRGGACLPPTESPEKLAEQLSDLRSPARR